MNTHPSRLSMIEILERVSFMPVAAGLLLAALPLLLPMLVVRWLKRLPG